MIRCGLPLLPHDTGLLCGQQSALTCAVLVRVCAAEAALLSGATATTTATAACRVSRAVGATGDATDPAKVLLSRVGGWCKELAQLR
jgi:hypothetical protein